MRKRGFRILGLVLIIVGAAILLNSFQGLTGFVVFEGIGVKTGYFVGVVLVAAGILVLQYGRERESQPGRRIKTLDSLLLNAGRGGVQNIVLDTSAVIRYKGMLRESLRRFGGNVYVPKQVVVELGKNPKNRRLLTEFYKDFKEGKIKQIRPGIEGIDVGDYREKRRTAGSSIMRTRKFGDYKKARIHLEGKRVTLLPRQERAISKAQESASKRLGRYPRDEETIADLKKMYGLTKGDLDVLTTATYLAERGEKTEIIASDPHLRDSVADLTDPNKPINKKLKKNLLYEDYEVW